jgi:hypothetical protein
MCKKKKIITIIIVSFLLGGAAVYYFVLSSFELADLKVDPAENYINKPFKLTIDVVNTGLIKGEHTVEFFVNGALAGRDTIMVAGREISTASFVHQEPLAGKYLVKVGEKTITFEVFDEPALTSHPIDEILHYSAFLSGEIGYMGLEDKVDVFFKWRAVGDPIWIETEKQAITNEQIFSQSIKYLKAEIAYEFKAVVEWREEETISETLTFFTPELLIASFASVIDNPEDYLPENVERYGQVKHRTPVFSSLANIQINRPFTSFPGLGVEWVNVHKSDFVGDEKFYYVSWDWDRPGWVTASALTSSELSPLRGVDLGASEDKHLAMVYASSLSVRAEPGAIIEEAIVGHLKKYDVVSVQRKQTVNGIVWYEIALGQWIHSDYVRSLIPGIRPEGVASDEKWIEVHLASQTVYAHNGDTPLYASLISSGRQEFETPQGLFRPRLKMSRLPMSGDRFDLVYKLADVPWVTFFEKEYALHGTYWHDEFGMFRSAGCVNLSPFDSLWFSRWSDPELLAGQREVRPTAANPATWVYVHY